jgi:hypothetical protein
MHIQVPHPVPSLGYVLTQTLSFSIVRKGDGELGYVVTQTLSFSIFRYGMGNLDMHRPKHLVPPTEKKKNSMCGSIHIQVPHPVPSNRKTQCLGQYISKFPICIDPNIELFYCSVGGWGTWICIDPNIEFFYFSVRDGELGYVLTEILSFSIVR